MRRLIAMTAVVIVASVFPCPLEAVTLTWNGGVGDWDTANWGGAPPDWPGATEDAVLDKAGSWVNVVDNEAALSLSMSGGGAANFVVVQIADAKTLDIGTSVNAGSDYNFIILGDQSQLNTGTGAGAIAVLTTDAATTGVTTLKNQGNVSVGFFSDEWGAGSPERTFIKQGGGTLTMDNVTGTVAAAHTTFQIEEGTLAVRGPDPLGGSTAAIKLAGGNLSITGEVVVTYSAEGADKLRHYAWMEDWGIAEEVNGDFNNNGGLLAMTSTAVGSHLYDHGPIGTGIEMQNDGHFRTAMPEITRNDYFQNLWLGEITVTALDAGPHKFQVDNNDDFTSIFVDLDQDQIFSRSGKKGDELIQWENGNRTVDLAPGDYLIAIGQMEQTGNSQIKVQIETPLITPLTVIHPGGGAQVGMWKAVDSVVMANVSLANGVEVSADSALQVVTGSTASFGPLTLKQGILTVQGAPGGFSFTSTTIPAGTTGLVGVDLQSAANLGAIDANSSTVTIAKDGPFDLALETPNATYNNATFEARGGRLVIVDPSSSIGTAGLSFNGGEIAISSSSVAPVAIPNLIESTVDGTLRAGKFGTTGVAGAVVVSLDNLGTLDGILTLNATGGYSYHIPNAVTGKGLSLPQGTVTVDKKLDLGSLLLVGGILNRAGVPGSGDRDIAITDALTLVSGSLDMTADTLTLGPDAAVTIGAGRSLKLPGPLSVGSLDVSGFLELTGPNQDVAVKNALTLTGSDLDMSGKTLTLGPDAVVTINPGRSLKTDTSLSVKGLSINGGTLAIAEASPSVTATDMFTLANVAADFELKGTAGLTVNDPTGTGIVSLTGSNTYTGKTDIRGGALIVEPGAANLGPGNVTINGGSVTAPSVLVTSGTFARELGAGDGKLMWDGQGGGFAAQGGALTIELTPAGGAAGDMLEWPYPDRGFNRKNLVFGHRTADSLVELTNPIELPYGEINFIYVFDNPDTDQDVAKLSGDITDTGGNSYLFIGGDGGTLWLAGTTVLKERTQIDQGVLRGEEGVTLPSLARIEVSANNMLVPAVVETWGTFERDLGFSSDDGDSLIRWQDQGGGFSAWSAPLTVNLQDGIPIEWNLDNKGFWSTNLQLGSPTANDVVTLVNDLLMRGDRRVIVFDNPSSTADYAVISGKVEGNNSGAENRLEKWGDGLLVLSNPANIFRDLQIHQGIARVDDQSLVANQNSIRTLKFKWDRSTELGRRHGPVLETHGVFAREIGGIQNQVEWLSATEMHGDGGGFAAYDPDETEGLVVTLEGGAELLWSSDSAGFRGTALVLGSRTANGVVELTNALNMQGASRTVYFFDNPTTEADGAILSGVISNSGGQDLRIVGDPKSPSGLFKLTGTNTFTGRLLLENLKTEVADNSNLGDPSTELVLNGVTLDLLDTFGVITRPGNVGVGGATINVAPLASLTLSASASPVLGGGLVKNGGGPLVFNSNPIGGNVSVNEGVLQIGQDLLAGASSPANTLTLAAGTTLRASGYVNRHVVGDPTSQIVAIGDMTLGNPATTSYDYGGVLFAKAYSVGLGDAGEAELLLALVEGGGLWSSHGTRLAPDAGYLAGYGTIDGTFTMGAPGHPAAGAQGYGAGQRLEFTGLLKGEANVFDFVNVSGAFQPGFSPSHTTVGPGNIIDEVRFLIGGEADGEVVFDSAADEYVKTVGEHTQIYVYGTKVGDPAVPTLFNTLTLALDPDSTFQWTDLRAGKDLVLMMAGPWRTVEKDFSVFPPIDVTVERQAGLIDYGPNFASDLANILNGITLAPGLEWAPPTRDSQRLILTVVPEPGTLVLLLSGGLGLLLMVWRRRSK